jgi:outer membrane receptor for ferric coprogen and ferric-rhodotorulic acid
VPVTAWSAEASLQHAGRAWNGQLALFRTRVTHERILNPVTLALSDAGSSVRQGVWTALSWRPSARWQLDADLTVNDARIRGVGAGGAFLRLSGAPGRILPQFDIKHEAPLRPGDLVPAVARYHGRAGIDADVRGVSVRAETRFTGPFAPIGEPDVRTAAWAVLDLSCEIPLGDRAALDVALTNVADARYPEMRASGYLNPGAPRMLRAAMRLGGQPSAALHH